MSFLNPTRLWAGALAVFVCAATPALAADYCLNVSGAVYVGQGIKLPKAGKCTLGHGRCSNCTGENTQIWKVCTETSGALALFLIETGLNDASGLRWSA